MPGDSQPFHLSLYPGNNDRIFTFLKKGFFFDLTKKLAEKQEWGMDKARQEETNRWAAGFMEEKDAIVLVQPMKHRQAKCLLGAGIGTLGSPLSVRLLLSVQSQNPHLNIKNIIILHNRQPRSGPHSRVASVVR